MGTFLNQNERKISFLRNVAVRAVAHTFAGIVLALPLLAHAEFFGDCESVPGEYIVKFKVGTQLQGAGASSGPAVASVNTQLQAKGVDTVSAVSNTLEIIKSPLSHDQIKALMQSQLFRNNVEYIQANCVSHLYDYSVKGTLRDPAAVPGGPFPSTIVLPGKDSTTKVPMVISMSQQQGVFTFSSTFREQGQNGSVEREFFPSRVVHSDVSFPPDGRSDIVAFGDVARFNNQYGRVDRFPGYIVLSSKGNGSFDPPRFEQLSLSFAESVSGVAQGDLNGDHRDDFVVGLTSTYGGKLAILLSNQTETYELKTFELSKSVGDVQIADLNGDGSLDVAASTFKFEFSASRNGFDGRIEYFLNQGQARFSTREEIVNPSGQYHEAFRARDINKDGAPDLIIAGPTDLAWVLNNGTGAFGDYTTRDTTRTLGEETVFEINDLEIGDVDGDGIQDIALFGAYRLRGSEEEYPVLVFFRRDERGQITAGNGFLVSNNERHYDDRAWFADYNGDGRLDSLVVLGTAQNPSVFASKPPTDPAFFTRIERDNFYQQMVGSNLGHGVAIDPYGIAQVRIRLRGPGGEAYAVTDSNGNFEFPSLAAGTYTAEVEAPSYFFPTLHEKQLTVSENLLGLTFLGKRKPLPPPPAPLAPPPNRPNDYGFYGLWGLHNYGQFAGKEDADINAPQAWSLSKGEDVVVGVIDSGVSVAHPDLASNIFRNTAEIGGNGKDDDGNGVIDDEFGYNPFTGGDPYDEHSHGTHVAGTIAAISNNDDGVAGVAPLAKILPAKIGEGPWGALSDSSIIKSVGYMIAMKKRGANIRVVNASFGGIRSCSPAERDYITALDDNGILFVAAAGNHASDNDIRPSSPANCDVPNVISVAAIDRNGYLAEFSNYGRTKVHVAAPGHEISSLYLDAGYYQTSGTSMAAPHVAGVVALIASRFPSMTAAEIRSRIFATVKPLRDLEGKVVYPGVVDAFAALSTGGGGNGGGNTGGGNDGGNGGGIETGGGQPAPSFKLLFSFLQKKKGAKMRFDISSSNVAAQQELNNCSFSVLAGQGRSAVTANYRSLGTVVASQGARIVDMKRFTQPLQAPKSSGSRRSSGVQSVFLRAGATCGSGKVSVLSDAIQVRVSKAKTALPAKRWMQRLAANLRLQ